MWAQVLDLRTVPGRGVEASVRIDGGEAMRARMGSMEFAAELMTAGAELDFLHREVASADAEATGKARIFTSLFSSDVFGTRNCSPSFCRDHTPCHTLRVSRGVLHRRGIPLQQTAFFRGCIMAVLVHSWQRRDEPDRMLGSNASCLGALDAIPMITPLSLALTLALASPNAGAGGAGDRGNGGDGVPVSGRRARVLGPRHGRTAGAASAAATADAHGRPRGQRARSGGAARYQGTYIHATAECMSSCWRCVTFYGTRSRRCAADQWSDGVIMGRSVSCRGVQEVQYEVRPEDKLAVVKAQAADGGVLMVRSPHNHISHTGVCINAPPTRFNRGRSPHAI